MDRNGSPVVGYACSYVPVEIVMAAGFLPVRLVPDARKTGSDGYLHPNTCPYVKGLLADAGEGSYSGMDAVILANSCDAMRRLHDLWDAYVKEPTALFLDVPRKKDRDSVALFASGLRNLYEHLSGLGGGRGVSPEGLNASIRQVNSVRSAYRDLFHAQRDPDKPVRGSVAFSLIQDGALLDPPGFRDRVSRLIRDGKTRCSKGGKRIFLAGNALNSPELIAVIEAAGVAVVGIDTCFGLRNVQMDVEEDTPDPFVAIARRYLCRHACPRMTGLGEQVDSLVAMAKDVGADGVVLSKVKFCDGLTYNIPAFQAALTDAGMGCLVLENDCGWSDIEKVRIKVETFLEMG
ncbi:MAG TPA: 2-hydroxyacyl-CoA dehydratase family protein [Deltaproteobacteria bacterium]|nr:2-hydroxyacyl-CoA dehydratase family protein [Deltaproteobacteria bacterium]HPR53799.1 2-hydroxyacyl-CoA dehydratase family protein [Deltaproteobacteria bacterium]HXK46001.1 2-hydroxyacyl-CoA dehydratase family protein [Deltaproteobacteria bacterium]